MARIRSPNYPQIGLGAAIERVRMIYKAERQNRVDRDTAVKLMGFSGYNGASAGVLSAVLKFGLLEGAGEKDMKVSDLAVRILVPHTEKEKGDAISEASQKPPLFVELSERWPNDPPSDPSLRSYLTRRGFADSALEGVMKSYWDTLGLVRETAPQYNPDPPEDDGSDDFDMLMRDAPAGKAGLESPPAPLASPSVPVPVPVPVTMPSGPGMNLVRTDAGYIVQLSGSVLTKGHVDEVVALLTALKASIADVAPEAVTATEH